MQRICAVPAMISARLVAARVLAARRAIERRMQACAVVRFALERLRCVASAEASRGDVARLRRDRDGTVSGSQDTADACRRSGLSLVPGLTSRGRCPTPMLESASSASRSSGSASTRESEFESAPIPRDLSSQERVRPERVSLDRRDPVRKSAERRSAFESVALPHLDSVYRFALHLAGHEGDAQDLTQECFHQAFRKFEQFEPGTNCRAWLFRITRNAYIDRLRQRSRQPRPSDLSEEVVGVGATDPIDSMERWERLASGGEESRYDFFGDEVAKGLRELPDEFRAAVLLCDVEGLSYAEIAKALACPVGTVRSRISRARTMLKERLHDYAVRQGLARDGAPVAAREAPESRPGSDASNGT
jgi:RNA polymerase sigma factor (sigma-70 family)